MHLQAPTADTDEWDLLTTALNQYGSRHVAPGAKPKGPLPKGEELFFHLATSHAVRLQQAMISLLITHPDLDADARQAIGRLGGDARTMATYRYVAACALQRTWRTRLATDLGPRRPIQPAYLDRLALPPVDPAPSPGMTSTAPGRKSARARAGGCGTRRRSSSDD